MKIAVVSHDSFWPVKGGGGIRVFWVVKELVKKGYDVIVIAPFNETNGLEKEFPTITIKNLGNYSRFGKFKEFQYSKLALKIILSLIFTKVDAIYAHNIVAAYPSYIISKFKRIPLIFDMDDILTGLSANKIIRNIGQKLEFRIAKKTDALITMSNSLKQALEKNRVRTDIYTVSHGVNLQKFYPRDITKKNKIIYIGGVEPHDGTILLADAALPIIEKYPDIIFEIIGDGKCLPDLINKVSKYNILKNFTFVSWVQNEEIPEHLAESKIGIVTHFRTPATEICLVLKGLEYMAMGLPVVAPDLLGMREEFGDNERGLLFEPNNPRDLTAKLLRLLDDNQLQTKLGMAGVEFVKQNCNWEENAKKIVEISENCINRHKKH